MKKIINITLINSMLLQLSACYTPQLISKEELTQSVDNPGLVIKTKDQIEYSFEKKAYVVTEDSIIGKGSIILENGAKVDENIIRRIGLDDVETVKQEEIDGVKTAIYIAVSIGFSVLLWLGIKSLIQDATSNIASGVGQAIQNIYP